MFLRVDLQRALKLFHRLLDHVHGLWALSKVRQLQQRAAPSREHLRVVRVLSVLGLGARSRVLEEEHALDLLAR